MRYLPICLIIAVLALPCMAVQENITTGPYNISFDLGLAKNAYDIEILEPIPQEDLAGHLSTEYLINLTDGSTRQGYIKVILFEDSLVIPTQSELKDSLREALPYSLDDVETVGRDIDGHSGAAASAREYFSDNSIYFATYYLSQWETVTLMSKYPWEHGTLALLKTIHIEQNSTVGE